MNVLPNPRFRVGDEGWNVSALYALGVTWAVTDEGLVVRSAADAPRASSGSVLLHSPRVPVAPGPTDRTWRAGVRVRASAPAVVDLGVTVDRSAVAPGTTITAPPREAFPVGTEPVVLEVSREVPEHTAAVGLRVGLPAGIDVVVEEAWLEGPAETDALTGVSAGLVAEPAHAGFDHGTALVRAAGGTALLRVANEGAPREVALTVTVTDCYRESTEVVLEERLVAGDEPVARSVPLPAGRAGVFAVRAELRPAVPALGTGEATGQAPAAVRDASAPIRQAELRYLVADDLDDPRPDPGQAWALTTNLVNTERSAALLRLLGMAHTRVYVGFSAWDLPVASEVQDPAAREALAATVALLGLARGSVVGQATGEPPVLPPGTWPDFGLASTFLRGADTSRLRPAAELLDPFAGMTVLVETSSPGDDAEGVRVLRTLAEGLAGRGSAWIAKNEPDLSGLDATDFGGHQRTFGAAIREGDPGALLAGPVIADGWDSKHQNFRGWDWLVDWAKAGGLEAVDAVAIQSHMIEEETTTPEREDWEGLLARLRGLTDALGGAGKPVWVTEMGWRSDRPPLHGFARSERGTHVSEADQADLLVRTAVAAACAGVERFYAFHQHGMFEFGEGIRFDWGVLTGHTHGPKPAFAALRELARATSGLGRPRFLLTDRRTRAAWFEGEDRGVAVVWQWSGGPGLWRLDAAPPQVMGLSDSSGRQRRLTTFSPQGGSRPRMADLMGQPADGTDLRRPVLVRWQGDAAAVRAWLEACLAPRYPLVADGA